MLHTDYRRYACPICGRMPHIVPSRDADEPEPSYYKAFCTGNGTHISCGDWKRTRLEAWRDWKKRRVDKGQAEFQYRSNFSDILGPTSPFGECDKPKICNFLRRVQSGEFQLPDGMTWEQWLDYPYDGKFPPSYPFDA